MKQLLFLAFIVCSSLSYGQTFPLTSSVVSYGFPGANLPAVDTLKVYFLVGMMQVPRSIGLTECIGDSCHPVMDSSFNYDVWQKPGYIAEKKQPDQWNESFWMVATGYLDDKKQPLDSTLIIWQTHPRK